MAKPVVRMVEAYSVHGHARPGESDEELVDYAEFFTRLANSDPHTLRFAVGNDTVAISDINAENDQLAFRFVSGNPNEFATVYDISTAKTESVDPGFDRLLVNSAWAIIRPSDRMLFLERKRPGVPVYQIERFLTSYGRTYLGNGAVSVSLNPVPSRSFANEVARFTRIREAAITLRRPNHSWTKTAQGMLGQLGASNAAEVSLQLNASPGQSLSKHEGLVGEVINLARHPISGLRNAVIKGTRADYDGERSVSLRKHTVKGSTRVDPQADARTQLAPLAELANRLAEQMTDSGDVGESST